MYLFIKKHSLYLSPIICNIFNTSVREGIFPDICKIARVVPIHKGKSQTLMTNFRPISVLCISVESFGEVDEGQIGEIHY